jgi:hypothetical protein
MCAGKRFSYENTTDCALCTKIELPVDSIHTHVFVCSYTNNVWSGPYLDGDMRAMRPFPPRKVKEKNSIKKR